MKNARQRSSPLGPKISLGDEETIALLQKMGESLDRGKDELVEDRRRTGAYIEERRRDRAKHSRSEKK